MSLRDSLVHRCINPAWLDQRDQFISILLRQQCPIFTYKTIYLILYMACFFHYHDIISQSNESCIKHWYIVRYFAHYISHE